MNIDVIFFFSSLMMVPVYVHVYQNLLTSFSRLCDVNPESSDREMAFNSKLLLLINGITLDE